MNRLLFLFVGYFALGWDVPVRGQEFRIETQIYTRNQGKPVSENLTLFTQKIVYDFLFDSEDSSAISEIVIFDLDKNRFVLLDEKRQLKLEIPAVDLAQLMSSLRNSDGWREKFPFMLEPKFTTKFDEANNRLELTSKHVTYSAKLEVPSKPYAFPVFGQFVDAYAQLNATDPQKLPPFARLELNRELKSRKMMPTEIQMEMNLPSDGLGSWNVSVTSKHSVIWQLSKTDRDRIELANRHWTQFRTTKLAEYRNLPMETAIRK